MEEKERYRLPRPREKRTLAEELAKFSLCYALREHERARGAKAGDSCPLTLG